MATARENGANAVGEAVAVEVGNTEESSRGAQGMGGEYLDAFTDSRLLWCCRLLHPQDVPCGGGTVL